MDVWRWPDWTCGSGKLRVELSFPPWSALFPPRGTGAAQEQLSLPLPVSTTFHHLFFQASVRMHVWCVCVWARPCVSVQPRCISSREATDNSSFSLIQKLNTVCLEREACLKSIISWSKVETRHSSKIEIVFLTYVALTLHIMVWIIFQWTESICFIKYALY